MADNVSAEASSSRQEEVDSESMVEINIKTLDSQSFKLRVNKDTPVLHLKEKVADATGVPVNQQRLIYRGKVFKDDHLLSEYNFEDGCVLHLVARHPLDDQHNSTPASDRNTGHDVNRQQNRPPQGPGNVIFGTLNIGGNGERVSGDISREISEALRTEGFMDIMRTVGDSLRSFTGMLGPSDIASNVTSTPAAANVRAEGTNTNGGRAQPRHAGPGFAIVNQIQVSQLPPVGMMSRQLIVPDSLSTILELINHLDRALQSYNSSQPNSQPESINAQPDVRGVPTPQLLGSVIERTQQLLSGNVSSAFLHIARRLAEEAASTDPSVRSHIQTEAAQVGVAMQNIGALLLELGRATMMLRMGQSPADSFVNAGPSVFINSTGPNPIMVQPSLQSGSVMGASGVPISTVVSGPLDGADQTRHDNLHAGDAVDDEHSVATQPSNNTSTPGNSDVAHVLPPRAILNAIPARAQVVSPGHVVSLIVPVQLRTQQANHGQSTAPQGPYQPSGTGHPSAARVPDAQPSSGISSNRTIVSQIAAQVSSVITGSIQGHHAEMENASSSTATSEIQNALPGSSDVQSASSTGIRTNDMSAGFGEVKHQSQPSEGATSHVPDPSQQNATVSAAPLGLGIGGLQPKKRSKDMKPSGSSVISGGSSSANNNQQNVAVGQQFLQSLVSGVDASQTNTGSSSNMHSNETMARQTSEGQPDIGRMMSQVLNTPAFSNLLSNVAAQSGIGSPSDLRTMMEQCTQNPGLTDAFGRIVQQTEGQDIGGLIGASGSGQGLDLSMMMQQVMPLVSQIFGSGGLSASNSGRSIRGSDSRMAGGDTENQRNSQADVREACESIERGDCAEDIFGAVLRSAGDLLGPDNATEDLVEELVGDQDLANDYMDVLMRDVADKLKANSDSLNT